jgi:hypothetical protein
MNAIWVERCICGPKVYMSTTTNLLGRTTGGIAHGDPRKASECGRPVRYIERTDGSAQAGHYVCPVHGLLGSGSAWSYTEESLA